MRSVAVIVGSIGAAMLLGAVVYAGGVVPRPMGSRESTSSDAAISVYRAGLVRFDSTLVRLDSVVAAGDSPTAQHAFRAARAAYKRVELFTEYNGSFLVRELNGIPLPLAEYEDPDTPLAPVGLQVVEAELFPALDSSRVPVVRRLVGLTRAAVATLHSAGADTLPGDAYVFDAMRHEVARVATLGIAGFDATITGDGIVESADAILGVRDAFGPYRSQLARKNPAVLNALDATFDSASQYLRSHPDFASFDRLVFITRYANPLAHALAAAARTLGIGAPAKPRPWSARAASPFDRDAYDPRYFAALDAPNPNAALIALGRDLFFDPALSPSGTRSCGTCHLPERAFTDGRARPHLLDRGHPSRSAPRNTPTLINAGLQPTLFADNRVRTLEDQATDVLGSTSEMGGSLQIAASVIGKKPAYVERFVSAFGMSRDTAVSPRTLRLAIAAYVRSLTAMNSRFDRAARGDSTAMTAEERQGFNVFMGKGICGTCHFAPLFNGAMPPTLWESEPEVIGVPATRARIGVVVDPDSGRFNVRRIDQHMHAFKTPTVRNVELTAPYMHNGVFQTLEEVIDFYDHGGGAGLGIDLAHQTLPRDSLRLTKVEKRQLVAFLKTLTDTAGTTPPAAPR